MALDVFHSCDLTKHFVSWAERYGDANDVGSMRATLHPVYFMKRSFRYENCFAWRIVWNLEALASKGFDGVVIWLFHP